MHFLVRDRQDSAQQDMVATGDQLHNLPSASEVRRQIGDREVFNEKAEQPLV